MTAISDNRYADEDDVAPARAPRRRYSPPLERDAGAFRKASRHSVVVRSLKFVLPALAVAAVVAFWASARIIPGDLNSLVASAGIDAKSNSVLMDKPHISGFEGTRRAYEVKADTAVQSLTDPKVVTFKQIVGRFGLEDAGSATVNATVGVYDGNKNTLLLKDGVKMQTTEGYTGVLTDAAIDLAKGTLASSQPVELTSAEGKIRANSISVTERGKHVVFSDGVSVTFQPDGELAASPAGGGDSP